MKYELTLFGELPSHKNEKVATLRKRKKDTKKGVAGSTYMGIRTKSAVKDAMDRAGLQIPGDMRDLKLRHPKIEFYFKVARVNVDRDNIVSTVLDLLVRYGVLENDSISSCNHTITIYPAMLTVDEWETRIVLEDQ
jgi:Holliday junction resolvase RusA-like endonuclease